jgi:predicted dehydrogenase
LKIIYFFLNEGIINTLRKYAAHKYPQKRYLTFTVIRYNQVKYVNVSLQFQTEPADFVIINKFYTCPEIDFENISNHLDDYLSQFNQFGEVENYALLNIDTSFPISLEVIHKSFDEQFDTGLFIYGLGGYVKMFIMHHLRKIKKIACIDYKAQVANAFKRKYDFKYDFVLPSNSFPLLKNVTRPIVIIATYHSDHAFLSHEIFKINPNAIIFIEKPPTVTLEDLDKLVELYNNGAHIEFGFNRRFIDYSRYVKSCVKNKVIMISCSVKEVNISSNHWYLWKNQGTRITGNLVHWFDLANYWIQSIPVEINLLANPLDPESVTVSVLYKNGSLLNILASDRGNSLRGVQEKIEIRYEQETIFIDDFTSLVHIKSNGIKIRKRKLLRKKGHNVMYKNFLQLIERKKISDYSVFDLIRTSVVTFYASEMVLNGIRNMNIENEIDNYCRRIITPFKTR